MKKFILFFLLTIPMFAFAKKAKWVDSPESFYPSSQYIVAVGSGEDRSSAESSAKFALCQILGEKIVAEQNTFQFADSQGNDYSKLDLSIQEKVLFEKIVGVKIKETCCDKENKSVFENGKYKNKKVCIYYALAVLKKGEAILYYSSKINDISNKISDLKVKANEKKGSFQSVALMNNAVKLAEENEYNIEILSAIQGMKATVDYDGIQNIKNYKTSISENVRISVNVKGDDSGKIATAFQNSLRENGFTVVKNDYNHILNVSVSFENLDGSNLAKNTKTGSEYEYVRYNLVSELKTVSDENVILPYECNGREGHTSISQAKTRAIQKIVKRISEEYSSQLDSCLESF